MAMIDDSEFEFTTTDQGFAAFLATRFMFMDAVDTGEVINVLPNGVKNTRKAFLFLLPKGTDPDRLKLDYELGTDDTRVPFVVAFNKMRLIRQSCRKPFNHAQKVTHGKQ